MITLWSSDGEINVIFLYIFALLSILQKFKVWMLLPIVFLTPLCLTGGRYKAGDQPIFTNIARNMYDLLTKEFADNILLI